MSRVEQNNIVLAGFVALTLLTSNPKLGALNTPGVAGSPDYSFAQSTPPEDASAPLRRFPVQIMVTRPNAEIPEASLLRLTGLRPRDEISMRVGDKLTRDWTLATAYLSAGQKVKVQTWNLWERRWQTHPLNAGKVPEGDVVPLFFLVLNRNRDGRIGTAIQRALETNSEQIVSETASFESTYKQQNRLYNFLTAYAALGPKANPDPIIMHDRIFALDADMGFNPNPNAPLTTPGDVQRGLDASYGFISQLRENPDNPTAAAQAVQDQLPTPVADWLGLVSDLMHFVIRPHHDLSMSFIPASAGEARPDEVPDGNWMELVTERVPETKDHSLPVLVFRPPFEKDDSNKPPPLEFAKTQVVSGGADVSIPLGAGSRDLFLHPYAWDWEVSKDDMNYAPLPDAHLVPGAGLVFPVNAGWWSDGPEQRLSIRARVGFALTRSVSIRVAHATEQTWALDAKTPPDLAVGDGDAKVVIDHAGGVAQPFYDFSLVTLQDSAGAIIVGHNSTVGSGLTTWFDLSKASPGPAKVLLRQDPSQHNDPPVDVYIAPKRANISVQYAQGDKVVRVTGPDASLVTSVKAAEPKGTTIDTVRTDDSDPNVRQFILSQPIPQSVAELDVSFRSAGTGQYSWEHKEPINVGSPRPKIAVQLIGTLPSEVPIGGGADPSWAMATMPPGWFRTKQPIKLELDGVAPYRWSHDVTIELGFGPTIDVQKAYSLVEGVNLSIDASNPTAIATLSFDGVVPPGTKRTSGTIWMRATRGDLSSGWTLATLGGAQTDVALHSVKLPTITSIDTNPTRTHVVFADAEQLMSVKVASQSASIMPQLLDTTAAGLNAAVDLPSGCMEFDLQLQDSPEGLIHVKILRTP